MASGTPSTYRLGQRCVASRERSSAVSRTGSDIRRRTRILATNATRRSKSVLTLSYDHTRVSPVQDRARISPSWAMYVAYLNRAGPGNVCAPNGVGQS
jgi:hypothetical protein